MKEVKADGAKIGIGLVAGLAGAAGAAYLSNAVIPKIPGYDTLDIAPKLKDAVLFVAGAAGYAFVKEPSAAAFFLGMSAEAGKAALLENIPGVDKSDFGMSGIGAAKGGTNWQALLEAAKTDTAKQLPANEKGTSVEVASDKTSDDEEEEVSGIHGVIGGIPGEIGDLKTQESVMFN